MATDLNKSKDAPDETSSNESKSFSGFGQCASSYQIGPAGLNLLRTLKAHSKEYKDLSVEFKSGKDNRLKAIWSKNTKTSLFRLCPSISFSDSDASNAPRLSAGRKGVIHPRLHAMRTRSQGKTAEMPNVQTKTLEYNRKS